MYNRNTVLLLVALFSFSISFSQQKKPLTHILSDWEKELMQNTTRSFSETAPPTGEVRNIAEWEPMESVIIAYTGTFGIPYSLIANMSQDCNIVTIVANAGEENTVTAIYNNNGVNLAHCSFVYQDPDTYWTRDYSPWFVAVDNEIAIVNFPYNRPRPHDNDVPILMANELGVDLYGMNITHTGGNYMCDGYGFAASTDLVWEENTDQTHAEIAQKMEDYLGITDYFVLPDPLDDYIKHIDCWGKFLDVDKVLITQVPTSDYRYEDYEFVANFFATHDCSWGYPYEVIRVQAADAADYDVNPYTNSLILNNKVYVPQTGSDLDDDAIAVYEAAMPGYEVVGVYSNDWLNSDALHCRTHGVADRQMLYIKHYPLHGDLDFTENFEISAEVLSYGGSAVSPDYPKLHYKQNDGAWEEVVMTSTSGNTYVANIPGLNGSNTVSYYIEAVNEAGKSANYPRMGTADPFEFSYSGGSVGIADVLNAADITVYPNPGQGIFTIQSPGWLQYVTVYDTKGQTVYAKSLAQKEFSLDLQGFPSGLYYVQLHDGSRFITKKVVLE